MIVSVVFRVTFMYECEAAWPAKQRVGVEDGKIGIEL